MVAPAPYHQGPLMPDRYEAESYRQKRKILTVSVGNGTALKLDWLQNSPSLYIAPKIQTKVAAQVHEETTAEATRPDLTLRPAVENISEVWSSRLYLLRMKVTKTCNNVIMHASLSSRSELSLPFQVRTEHLVPEQFHSPILDSMAVESPL